MRKKSQKYFLPFIMLYFVGPIRQNIVVVGVGLEGGEGALGDTPPNYTNFSLPSLYDPKPKNERCFQSRCILYRGLSFFFVIDKVFRGLI